MPYLGGFDQMTGISRFLSKIDSEENESTFKDKIKVHTTIASGTQYVSSIDLLLTKEEKEKLYEEAVKKSKDD